MVYLDSVCFCFELQASFVLFYFQKKGAHYALISGHPGGLTPGTYRGMARDMLTFVANVWPWTGALDRFVLPSQDTRGKTRGICNIAVILKMKDNP